MNLGFMGVTYVLTKSWKTRCMPDFCIPRMRSGVMRLILPHPQDTFAPAVRLRAEVPYLPYLRLLHCLANAATRS